MALLRRSGTGWRSTIVLLSSMLLIFGLVGAAGAEQKAKVNVCHSASGTFHMINISGNALAAHLAHGDYEAGTAGNCGTIPRKAVADGYTFKLDGSTTSPQEYQYGTTATWVIQLTDGGKAIAQAGWLFTISTDQRDTSGNVTTAPSVKLKTDAAGQIVITKRFNDPDRNDDADPVLDAYFRGRITGDDGLPPATPSAWLKAVWNDDDPVATTIKVSTASDYKVNKNGESNAVTATVKDQFGNDLSGVDVCFTSTSDGAAEGVGTHAGTPSDPDSVDKTNSAGQAVLHYTWDWDAAATRSTSTAVEKFIASFETDVDADLCDDRGVQDNNNVFYWVNVAANGTDTGDAAASSIGYSAVLVDDVPNKAVVAKDDGGVYTWWQWDSGDQFTVPGTPDNMATFEKQIAKDSASPPVDQQVRVANYNTSGVSQFWAKDN
jgi:hypothetical protein